MQHLGGQWLVLGVRGKVALDPIEGDAFHGEVAATFVVVDSVDWSGSIKDSAFATVSVCGESSDMESEPLSPCCQNAIWFILRYNQNRRWPKSDGHIFASPCS